jgi:hypothetical protein
MSATKLVVRSHTTRVRLLEVVKSKSMYHSLDSRGWWFVYADSAGLHRFWEFKPHKSGFNSYTRVSSSKKDKMNQSLLGYYDFCDYYKK